MAVAIEVLNHGKSGDPEFHVAGCADVKRTIEFFKKRGDEPYVDHFEGETIIEALVALDTEWASSFGVKDPYSESANENGCWTWGNMKQAPCMNRLMKGVTTSDEFGGHNRPFIDTDPTGIKAVAADAVNDYAANIGLCECGCGGAPKGKKSRFLPGHDAKAASAAKAAVAQAAGFPDAASLAYAAGRKEIARSSKQIERDGGQDLPF